MTQTTPDFLDLSDEEIMNMTAPVNAPAAADVVESTPQATSELDEGRTEGADGSTPPASAGEANADGAPSESALGEADDVAGTAPAKKDGETVPPTNADQTPPADDGNTTPPANAKVEAEDKTGETPPAKAAPTAEDHKAFYDLVLGGPIKANGKEIRLQSPDEAVKLIQMGLNYTKKMQTMQPVLRVAKMLENNGLMDEAKLSHLIDVSKGDSGAIQKLLADTGFDPLTADAEKAKNYAPADHRVSDLELSFDEALREVEQTPVGVELITEVHGQWDADSKRALFKKPQLLTLLAEQKANGLYAQVAGEVERLRALGEITPDIPFLQAYHAVGDMMHQQGRLRVPSHQEQTPAVVAPPAVPVETRVATPPPVVKNTAQAQATAPIRTAPPTQTPTALDYLGMDDAEFAKQTVGRF